MPVTWVWALRWATAKGYDSAAGADVEKVRAFVSGCPGSEEYAVGAYFHGAMGVVDMKLFEGKHRVCVCVPGGDWGWLKLLGCGVVGSFYDMFNDESGQVKAKMAVMCAKLPLIWAL